MIEVDGDRVFEPGSLVFLKPGGLLRMLNDNMSLMITHRMMTNPCLVLSVPNRMIEEFDRVSRVHVLLVPQEGIMMAGSSSLSTMEEMLSQVKERYGHSGF